MSRDKENRSQTSQASFNWRDLLWKGKNYSYQTSVTSNKDQRLLDVAIEEQPKCPVDHSVREAWKNKVTVLPNYNVTAVEETECNSDRLKADTFLSTSSGDLPSERVISSIPRTSSDSNWIYPSEKQFYDAMRRKKFNPQAEDMQTVVPIHNAVNEMAWQHIMAWEKPHIKEADSKCGGIKLTSFKGNSRKLTPRAWLKSRVLGEVPPFDRHDWKVDRCGIEVDYVIDFYASEDYNMGILLDVRPKLNSLEGVKSRFLRALGY